MSLTTALGIAQSSILNTSRQTSVLSRNITNANNPDYTRRSAVISSEAPGARIMEIRRAANDLLSRQNLAALSAWTGQETLLAGMERLGLSVNGVDNATSPATAIGKLQTQLQFYATAPADRNLAETTVEAARQVVRTLNDGQTAIQTFRAETDLQIASAVDDLNGLLTDFHQANRAVVSGTQTGKDVSDVLDQRDALLKKISEYIPVTAISRGANDMVLTTRAGATLYETVPRAITFEPVMAYAPGAPGNAVSIDGVPLPAGTGGNTDASGRIASMLQLRDGVASTMQAQLDEVARGLIVSFAETDPSGGGLPDAPGLFTWPGAPAMPTAGTISNGLAGLISINAAMDSTMGGNPALLRDGGANGAGYVANTTGGAGFSGLLRAYTERLDQPIAYDPAAGLDPSASVVAFSADSIGWFEAGRQQAFRAEESKNALMVRTAEALSNDTGVNIDQEMSLLLDLEHSFEASARLIKTIDEMLGALLAAVS
jgi:flagellar hook-associated protein 1 FlgK